MIKKIKGSLFIKVFITTAILLTGVSFLVYLILAWYTPKTYSNTLNATLDEQTKIFISEISQMPMEETGGIFDNFLDYLLHKQPLRLQVFLVFSVHSAIWDVPHSRNAKCQ